MCGFYVGDNKVSPQVPYYFYLPYRELFMVAGIWNMTKINRQTIYTFSLLTKEADANVKCINKRMPVIVTPANHQSWLEDSEFEIANLLSAPPLYFYKLGNNTALQHLDDYISLA
jgi:putative SOS response-associated peptidase YedK